jgi:hypothetical protein
MMSISAWENLTVECGWTSDEYATRKNGLETPVCKMIALGKM